MLSIYKFPVICCTLCENLISSTANIMKGCLKKHDDSPSNLPGGVHPAMTCIYVIIPVDFAEPVQRSVDNTKHVLIILLDRDVEMISGVRSMQWRM